MIDRNHGLPLRRRVKARQLSRGTLYYEPRPVPMADLAVMQRIEDLHLDHPFAGSRMMRDFLGGEDIPIGREKLATMMRRMGIKALSRRPNRSNPKRTRHTRHLRSLRFPTLPAHTPSDLPRPSTPFSLAHVAAHVPNWAYVLRR